VSELVFFRRGEEVLRFKMDSARVVLGRGDGCDVVIPDDRVSRQQVALVSSDDKVFAEDLSERGTVVSGATVGERKALSDGAEIELGQWRAVWHQNVSATDIDERATVERRRANTQASRIRMRSSASSMRCRSSPLISAPRASRPACNAIAAAVAG